jgi:hypothetical protein
LARPAFCSKEIQKLAGPFFMTAKDAVGATFEQGRHLRVKVTETDPFLKLQHKMNRICKNFTI